MALRHVIDLHRDSDWSGVRVLVAGIGVSGFAAADALLGLGASVTVVDGKAGDTDRTSVLENLGATVRLGDGDTLPASLRAGQTEPEGVDLVVTSPGWRPDAPLLVAALAAGIPVWGEVELAWRLRPTENPAAWLAITGTNGKTTTVRMLTSILNAAGLRAVAAGNVGTPLLEVVMADAHDVLAVELSSFQLHWSNSVAVHSSAVLNIAPDHVDWHGGLDAYAAAKGLIYRGVGGACIYNLEDLRTVALMAAHRQKMDGPRESGARAVGFTLGAPRLAQLGVVDNLLVDRAFDDVGGEAPAAAATELASFDDIRPLAPHNVANALAAAALARSYGVPAAAVREGLRAFSPDGHRIAEVGVRAGVRYVDDSKATNPHAAAASLAAYERVVWIAGGLAKGAEFDDLVADAAPRLRAAVLIGTDRPLIRAALARHAPDVPVIEVADVHDGAMEVVVAQAARLATAGDTVLLAPACASMDMFTSYAERGDKFAAAVLRLPD